MRDGRAAGRVVAAEGSLRPRKCVGGGAIFADYWIDEVAEPKTPLAAIKAHEVHLFTGEYAPRIMGYQVVERSLPLADRQRLRVVAWDSGGFARRSYDMERGAPGGWVIYRSAGCPKLPLLPRSTDNDLTERYG